MGLPDANFSIDKSYGQCIPADGGLLKRCTENAFIAH